MFANFNRFLALTESSFRVSSLTANGNRNGDGYLDGKEGASISFKAPCISATSIDRPLLPKLKKIVYTHARFSYPLSSALRHGVQFARNSKSQHSKFPFSATFSPQPSPSNQNQYPSFQLVPDDKRNEFLEPSQFDFASKSKQAIGGMLKT